MVQENISVIVMVCEEWELRVPIPLVRAMGQEVYHCTAPDFGTLKLSELLTAVQFVVDRCHESRQVFVHCYGGKGRSAVVVIAALMRIHGWTKEQAFKHVLNIRPIANMPRFGIFCNI